MSDRRQVGHAGLCVIREFEQLRLVAYKPTPDDIWTVGWGHTRTAKPGMKITPAEADKLLQSDCFDAERAVDRNILVPLNQNQYDALVSLAFNIGKDAFRKSTLARKLNAGDYVGAAREFPKWKYQNGKMLGGLVRRRKAERELFETPAELSVT
jgi:lysozyme